MSLQTPTFLQRTFTALSYPNYRLWFLGQLVSLIGTWMQMTAQSFLVFELTKSTAYLGLVGFAAGVPSWVLMLYAGVITDRVPRRTLLLITQSIMLVLAFVLAGLTWTRLVQPWHIVALALALGAANAFDAPARQAFAFELVDREHLTNAIALNASMFNLGSVVGPAVAGVAYVAVGAAWCFAINGLSFIAVIVALVLMRLPPHQAARRAGSAFAQLREGVRYTIAHPLLPTLIAIPGTTALFGAAYNTLLPAWAVDVLGGDATTNGLLQAARGIGSFAGAMAIAAFAYRGTRGRWITNAMFVFPIMLIGFTVARWTSLSMLLLVGIGFCSLLIFNLGNTLVQSHVSDELRGRVMSIYTLTFFGGMPLGALWAGSLAQYIGAPLTVAVSAAISILSAVFFWMRVPQLRTLT